MSQDSTEVNVDLVGLENVAGLLQRGIAEGFQNGASLASHMVTTGTPFAQALSYGQLLASRDLTQAASNRAFENMQDKAMAAGMLGEAIKRIITNYSDADEAVLGQLAIIQDALAESAGKTVAVVQSAPTPRSGAF